MALKTTELARQSVRKRRTFSRKLASFLGRPGLNFAPFISNDRDFWRLGNETPNYGSGCEKSEGDAGGRDE